MILIAVSTFAEDAYYIVKGGLNNDCSDLNCTIRVVDVEETRGVRCCADSDAQLLATSEWTYVDSCGLWVISWLFSNDDRYPMCFMANWEKAAWLCDSNGGRLCTKSELENGCTADNGNRGCDLDSYMIWSNTSGEITNEKDSSDPGAVAYYYAARGSTGTKCLESDCSTKIVSQFDIKGVRCCSETQVEADWDTTCSGIWADAPVPFCYFVDWNTANNKCSEAGGRLCTIEELEDDCAKGTGCYFDQITVWSSTIAYINSENPTVDPTNPPTESLTESPTLTSTWATPVANWVKVGCSTDGVYTEVIKDQVIGDMLQITSSSEIRNLLFAGFFFDSEKLTGTIPLMLAATWWLTHSNHTNNTYRCDYFDNLKPFIEGCMWRLEISFEVGLHSMIWMPHIVKCSMLEPKCAPLKACANENCSDCKEGILSFHNTIMSPDISFGQTGCQS